MADFELERYELRTGPAYRFEPDRRDFLKTVAAGISVFLLISNAEAQESGRGGRRRGGQGMPEDLAAWLHIDEDGTVRVFTGKVEVGQNARTSLTQAVAEELHAKPDSIEFVMGDTDLTPYDMGTFGSRTTPIMFPQIRKVAAAAREMLLDLAAKKWSADRATLSIADGQVRGGNQSASFAQLTKGQTLTRSIAADTKVSDATEWKCVGHDLEKVHARDMVTGKHRFARDITRPGMLHGKVIRAPQWKAKLVSADTKAAEQMAGVTVVRDGNYLAVASANPQQLKQAASAIRAEWQAPPQIDNARLIESFRKTAPARTIEVPEAATKADATYTVAYIAHIPLETRAAVAEWNNGKLTVWTGTQVPFGVRSELTEAFGLKDEQVRVIVPDTGSGYGGKHTGEAALEAARLAKATGKPVRVTWSREEEFAWAYFRPAGVIDVYSAASKDGTLLAWEFHNFNSGGSGLQSPYAVAKVHQQFHECDSPLRQGSYRGLAATANHFARESHMDELAHALGMEPLAFRLKNASNPRLRAVVEAAAERFGWGKSKGGNGQGFGMSAGFEKGGYVACCVEVQVAGTQIKVVRVTEAFECGAVVNPEHLKNQIEGGVLMGLGGALFESVEFADGMIRNGRLSKYRVPRFLDIPKIETVLVDRKDLPSAGAGETPIVGIAPAIANAVFQATGKRLRSMPLQFS